MRKYLKKVQLFSMMLVLLLIVSGCSLIDSPKYKKAVEQFEQGNYTEAQSLFAEISQYEDSKKYLQYIAATRSVENNDFVTAAEAFNALADFLDSRTLATHAYTEVGNQHMREFQYDLAKEAYTLAGDEALRELAYHSSQAASGKLRLTNYYTKRSEFIILPDNLFFCSYERGIYFGLLSIGEKSWFCVPQHKEIDVYVEADIAILDNTIILDLNTGEKKYTKSNIVKVCNPKDGLLLCENKDGLWGMVDYSGNIVIEPEYLNLLQFSEGLAAAKNQKGWGYIDLQGNTVIDFLYEEVTSMSNGLAAVYLPNRAVKKGELYQTVPAGWGVINSQGDILVEPVWKQVYLDKNFIDEGVVKVQNDKYLFGLAGLDGTIRLQPLWTDMGTWGEGLLFVTADSASSHLCTSGYVDASGKMIIRLNNALGEEEPFKNGIAILKVWVKVSDSFYDSHDIFSVIIDRNGNKLLEHADKNFSQTEEGLIYWRNGGQKGYYKYENGELISIPSEEKSAFMKQWYSVGEFSKEGIACVILGTDKKNIAGYGFITQDEKVLVEPHLDGAKDFSEGLAAVKLHGLWGYIDEGGKFVIEPQYKNAESFRNGYAIVENTNREGVIINSNNEVLLSGFDYYDYCDRDETYYFVEENNKIKIYDFNGRQMF